MEIKYKNTVEDVEFLLSYYSAKFLKYYFYPLYFVSLPVTCYLRKAFSFLSALFFKQLQ